MMSPLQLCLFLFLLLHIVFSTNIPPSPGYCPPLGSIFPAPKQLPRDLGFSSACDKLTAALNKYVESVNQSLAAVSLQIFDANHASPLFSFSSTSSSINTTLGVAEVDEDTVFRMASVSKLWTVLLILIEKGFSPFSDPITKYIPELRDEAIRMSRNDTEIEDKIDFVSWDEVTVGELASQLTGIARECLFPQKSCNLFLKC